MLKDIRVVVWRVECCKSCLIKSRVYTQGIGTAYTDMYVPVCAAASTPNNRIRMECVRNL